MPNVPTIDAKPLYAIAGVGELAVERLRTRATALPGQVKELPSRAGSRQIDLVNKAQSQVIDLRNQAIALPGELRKTAETLPADVRRQAEELTATLRKQRETLPTLPTELRNQAETLPESLRRQVEDLAVKATAAYDEFAARGGQVVAGLRGDTPKPKRAPAKPAAKKASATKAPAG